jgi:hypothetical protein
MPRQPNPEDRRRDCYESWAVRLEALANELKENEIEEGNTLTDEECKRIGAVIRTLADEMQRSITESN